MAPLNTCSNQLLDFAGQLIHRAAGSGIVPHRERPIAMNRAEFEADLRREGYELREGEIEPNVHRGSHAHEFDARLFVLQGSITLVLSVDRCTYRPGDTCSVPAGTMHEEHTEADGVRYLAGRRPAAKVAVAE
ncbi:MAG TPA: cupin domain-containing protein [Stellaceae bacterium]|nr:cupin domain-containing protein [Stellaceae bacterium]HMD64260.1 cupin domain-containing protein [Stellaceae bacterium]